jgi:endothelin-converting enzyme
MLCYTSHDTTDTAHAERAPLLAGSAAATQPTFAERVTAIVHEPLSALSKLLLLLVLLFLLLSSVFIGLFAGAQHKLNTRKGTPAQTTTVINTVTATSISTAYPPGPTGAPEEVSGPRPTCHGRVLMTSVPHSNRASRPTASVFRRRSSARSTRATTRARTSTSLPVRAPPSAVAWRAADRHRAGNGWLKEHPLPADKGSFGTFNSLAIKNQQLIRGLLESDAVPNAADNYDAQLLGKLRGMYGSCMDEDKLDSAGTEPLLKVTRKLRELFHDHVVFSSSEKASGGLTRALAYLHTMGQCFHRNRKSES